MRLPVCVVGLVVAACHAGEAPAAHPAAAPPAPHGDPSPSPPRAAADPLDLDFEYGGAEVHEVGPAAAGSLGATFAGLGMPLAVIDLRGARGAAKAWLAAPHRTREIGALFTTEAHMDSVTRLSSEFDAALFIDRTTASRPL